MGDSIQIQKPLSPSLSAIPAEDIPSLALGEKTKTYTTPESTHAPNATPLHPMAIKALRIREYNAGDFITEEQLANGSNYSQYIVSYLSEGIKIYGLLTIPLSTMPEGGFPAILFIHGYIPPAVYSTTKNYSTYQDRLAKSGFVIFKPDLRGHGRSQGSPNSGNLSPDYVIDTLFALEYLKNDTHVNPEKIGYWEHSNGGGIGLKSVIISKDIKAASLWAGMVGSYKDMLETYKDEIPFLQRDFKEIENINIHGIPSQNPDFWKTIDPHSFLEDISVPIQIQHGNNDKTVPVQLSQSLYQKLQNLNKDVTYYEYQGDNHNISKNVNTAFERDIQFFKQVFSQNNTMNTITLKNNNQELKIKLNNSSAAKSLYEQLPLNIEIENYSNNEKIFYPPQKLDISQTPLANAKNGSVAYYAPWGDVVLFYDDFGKANELYEIGEVISGNTHIKDLSGTIELTRE